MPCTCGYPDCHITSEPTPADQLEFGRYLDVAELRTGLADVARILAPLLAGDGLALPCLNIESACMSGTCGRCRLERIISTYQRG